MSRAHRRADNELRPVRLVLGYQSFAEGSALIELGQTRVLCSVSMEERVPVFLKGSDRGWVTAEYAMLPRSTVTRTPRNRAEGRLHEIQRVIGRSLRAVTNLNVLGERTFVVDCDVLQADGGTRTAAITGGYVALYHAFHNLRKQGILPFMPLSNMMAATFGGTASITGAPALVFAGLVAAGVLFARILHKVTEVREVQEIVKEGLSLGEFVEINPMVHVAEGMAKVVKLIKLAIYKISNAVTQFFFWLWR